MRAGIFVLSILLLAVTAPFTTSFTASPGWSNRLPTPALADVPAPTQQAALFRKSKLRPPVSPSSRIRLSGKKNGEDDAAARAKSNNEARVDVRNLLTQRAIQSFMYLLTSLRDPHSGKWIEDVLETKNQLEYHGTGAGYMQKLGGTWDGPLRVMMDRPKDKVIVKLLRRAARPRKGLRSKSKKKNPYLKDKYTEFEIDIDPVSLVNRILSVREQIANEWATTDLDIVAAANDQILDSYFSLAKEKRRKKEDGDSDDTDEVVFERTANNILNNHTAFVCGSSPIRKSNFDLLYNLCTQASIHRVLHDLAEEGEAKEISFEWLREFYSERVADYFDGHQQFGRADDFLDELLRVSPSLKYLEDGKRAGLVDPLGLAERIIKTRGEIVKEWKKHMERVPRDHAKGIRKAVLEKQMAAWGSQITEGCFE